MYTHAALLSRRPFTHSVVVLDVFHQPKRQQYWTNIPVPLTALSQSIQLGRHTFPSQKIM